MRNAAAVSFGLPPGSAPKRLAQRIWMAQLLPRLAPRRDPTSRALAAALRTTAFGRLPPDERAWADRIERRRRELIASAPRRSPQQLGVVDFAGAVEWMSVTAVLGRFLMRLVRELAPASVVEIGTGFGFSGAYQGAALELNAHGRLLTIDVAPQWSAIAREGFDQLGLDRVEAAVLTEQIREEDLLARAAPIDLALIDSDHREAETVASFDRLLPHLAAGATVLLDDVGFTSETMKRAWASVAAKAEVDLALRFARMGVVVVGGGRRAQRGSASSHGVRQGRTSLSRLSDCARLIPATSQNIGKSSR
jgi:predicted O-methyltransferase YrrM